jgi:hypothetical protein
MCEKNSLILYLIKKKAKTIVVKGTNIKLVAVETNDWKVGVE